MHMQSLANCYRLALNFCNGTSTKCGPEVADVRQKKFEMYQVTVRVTSKTAKNQTKTATMLVNIIYVIEQLQSR